MIAQNKLKKTLFVSSLFSLILISTAMSQPNPDNKNIYLIIRGDDMGFSHSANMACIESYKNGVMKTVELMPVGSWFIEAVELLKQYPELDVGILLALTSEWTNLKWRPLTSVPSLVDSNGYFFPMVWQNQNFSINTSIQLANWKIDEIEKELRAQIELALKHVTHISHTGGHMDFAGLDPKIKVLMKRLAIEYGINIDLSDFDFQYMRVWDKEIVFEDRIDMFCEKLNQLKPGYHLFVDHPSQDVPEMKAISHPGYNNVCMDREWVTRVFTSEKVKRTINEQGIHLISYRDLADR